MSVLFKKRAGGSGGSAIPITRGSKKEKQDSKAVLVFGKKKPEKKKSSSAPSGSQTQPPKKKYDDYDEYSDNDSYNGEDSPAREEPSDALSFLLGKKRQSRVDKEEEDLSVDGFDDYDDALGEDEPDYGSSPARGETDVLAFLRAGKNDEVEPRQRKGTDMLSYIRQTPVVEEREVEAEAEAEAEEEEGRSGDGLLSFLLSSKKTEPDELTENKEEGEGNEGTGEGDFLSFLLSSKKTDTDDASSNYGEEGGTEHADVHQHDDDDDFDPDVKYGEDSKGNKVIKAATVNRLVDSLLTGADPVHRNSFLMTYRGYLSPVTLIDHLQTRYHQDVGNATENSRRKVRIIGVLKAWVEQFFYDFEEEAVKEKLDEFLGESTMESSADRLKKVFRKSQKDFMEKKIINEKLEAPRSGEPKSQAVRDLETGWKDLGERVLAQQMTILESDSFNTILPKECLSWTQKNKEKLCPHLWRMIQHFNEVSSWVRSQLVRECRLQRRIDLLEWFIRLMEELLILNNFNGMMEVLSGLNSAAVRRMKKTFGGIGPGYAKKLKSMEDLLSHRYSFRAYREHLHTIAPPCIPYMGIYLTDLTFILDGNSDIIDGNLVNFFKLRKVAEIIIEIQQYQSPYRDLQKKPNLALFLQSLTWMGEEECYRWSSRVEPKKIEPTVLALIHEEEKLKKRLKELKEKDSELLLKYKSLQPLPAERSFSSSFIPTTCNPGKFYSVWKYEACIAHELSTEGGEVLTFVSKFNDGWSYYKNSKGKVGLLPKTYVRQFPEKLELGVGGVMGGAGNGGVTPRGGARTSRKYSMHTTTLRLVAPRDGESSSPVATTRLTPPTSPEPLASSPPTAPPVMGLDSPQQKPQKPKKPTGRSTPRISTPPTPPPIMTHSDSPKMTILPRDVAVPSPISPNSSPLSHGNASPNASPPGDVSPKSRKGKKGKEREMAMPPPKEAEQPDGAGDRRSTRGSQVIGTRLRMGTNSEDGPSRCVSVNSLSGQALPQHGAAFSTSFSSLPVSARGSIRNAPPVQSKSEGETPFTGLPASAKKADLDERGSGGSGGSGTPKSKKREGGSLLKKTESWLIKNPSKVFR